MPRKLPLVVTGIVNSGEGAAARDYGIPTANIVLDEPLDLDFGVYATRVHCKAGLHAGALCYGIGSPPKFEVHLLNFEGNLYGKEIRVEVIEKVSELVYLGSEERMRHKILHDIELVREVFSRIK